MSKLLLIFGVVLGAIGLAFGIVGLIAPERLASFAMSFDTAAIFLVGGLLIAGLSNVLSFLEKLVGEGLPTSGSAQPSISTDRLKLNQQPQRAETAADFKPAFVPPPPPPTVPPLKPLSLPQATSDEVRSAVASVAATAAAASSISLSEKSILDHSTPTPNPTVADAINALEQAKTDMRAALGGNLNKPQPPYPEVAIPPPHDLPEDEDIVEDVVEEVVEEEPSDLGQLYVVEEKMIRGRPARILSDGTVEAETDDGWMRFENIEHLNEFLDS
jgi:hypothetical protein